MLSLAQLTQAQHGKLKLDVSAAGLLPAAIECLPTDPAGPGAAISTATNGRGHTTVTLTGPAGPPGRTYAGADFPMLTARRGAGPGIWSYYPGRVGWTTRSAVSYAVRAEVTALSY